MDHSTGVAVGTTTDDNKMEVKKDKGVTTRKSNKPLIEKRRRARINECLQQLKEIIVQERQLHNTRCHRLEKADILEMTVDYIRQVSRQECSASVLQKAYHLGAERCVHEMTEFMSSRSDLIDTNVTQSLITHCRKMTREHGHAEDFMQELAGQKRTIDSSLETFADSSTSPKRHKLDHKFHVSINENKDFSNKSISMSIGTSDTDVVSSTKSLRDPSNLSTSPETSSKCTIETSTSSICGPSIVYTSPESSTTSIRVPSIVLPTKSIQIPSIVLPTKSIQVPSTVLPTKSIQVPSIVLPTKSIQVPSIVLPTKSIQVPSIVLPTKSIQVPSTVLPTKSIQIPSIVLPTKSIQVPSIVLPTKSIQVPSTVSTSAKVVAHVSVVSAGLCSSPDTSPPYTSPPETFPPETSPLYTSPPYTSPPDTSQTSIPTQTEADDCWLNDLDKDTKSQTSSYVTIAALPTGHPSSSVTTKQWYDTIYSVNSTHEPDTVPINIPSATATQPSLFHYIKPLVFTCTGNIMLLTDRPQVVSQYMMSDPACPTIQSSITLVPSSVVHNSVGNSASLSHIILPTPTTTGSCNASLDVLTTHPRQLVLDPNFKNVSLNSFPLLQNQGTISKYEPEKTACLAIQKDNTDQCLLVSQHQQNLASQALQLSRDEVKEGSQHDSETVNHGSLHCHYTVKEGSQHDSDTVIHGSQRLPNVARQIYQCEQDVDTQSSQCGVSLCNQDVVSECRQSVDSQLAQRREDLVCQRSQEVSSQVSQRSQEVSSQVSQRSQEVSSQVSQRSQEVSSQVSQRGQEVSSQVSQRSQEVSSQVSQRGQEVSSQVSQRSQEVSSQVSQRSQDVATTNSKNVLTVVNYSTPASQNISKHISQNLHAAPAQTSHINQSFTSRNVYNTTSIHPVLISQCSLASPLEHEIPKTVQINQEYQPISNVNNNVDLPEISNIEITCRHYPVGLEDRRALWTEHMELSATLNLTNTRQNISCNLTNSQAQTGHTSSTVADDCNLVSNLTRTQETSDLFCDNPGVSDLFCDNYNASDLSDTMINKKIPSISRSFIQSKNIVTRSRTNLFVAMSNDERLSNQQDYSEVLDLSCKDELHSNKTEDRMISSVDVDMNNNAMGSGNQSSEEANSQGKKSLDASVVDGLTDRSNKESGCNMNVTMNDVSGPGREFSRVSDHVSNIFKVENHTCVWRPWGHQYV